MNLVSLPVRLKSRGGTNSGHHKARYKHKNIETRNDIPGSFIKKNGNDKYTMPTLRFIVMIPI